MPGEELGSDFPKSEHRAPCRCGHRRVLRTVAAVLMLVGLPAGAIPARRAAHTGPRLTIRNQ